MAWFCAGEKRKIAPGDEVFLEFLHNPKSDLDNLWLVRKLGPSSIRFRWSKGKIHDPRAVIRPKLKTPMLIFYLLVQISLNSRFAGVIDHAIGMIGF